MALHPINELSLFSGTGGLSLALKIAEHRCRTICYVERDSYAAATLVARMEDQALDLAPIWDRIELFDGGPWHGPKPSKSTRRLNPLFVSWLMGLPPAWNTVGMRCDAPEMELYLSRQRSLLDICWNALNGAQPASEAT